MTHTLYILLAAGALGAPADPVCPCTATVSGPAGVYVQPAPASSGGMFGWLRNLLGPRQPAPADPNKQAVQPCKSSIQQATYVVPTVTAAPRRTIAPATNAPAPATTVVTQSSQVTALKVAEKYEDRVGHEKDYSWVTGHLFYIHADGGRWVVRYGLPDEIDRFGGSVVLAPGVEMRNYREGDLVCVYGDVLDANRTSRSLGGALYRVNVISLVDRAAHDRRPEG